MWWRHTGLILVLGLLLALGLLAAPQEARADIVSRVLNCEGNPCRVRFNAGGEIGAFRAAARAIRKSGRRVVIDGPCLSACAILADQARRNVCVTANARFGFHQGYIVARPRGGGSAFLVGRFAPSHSRDIAGWVKRNGGYPSRGWRVMGAPTAQRIWRRC
jgi:hypothetical protein